MPSLACTLEHYNPDFTRGKGENLRMLLGRSADHRTLIIGGALEGWRKIFRNSSFLKTLPQGFETEDIEYDLVLYHSKCAANRKDLARHLRILKEHAEHGRSILIFHRNFLSPSHLKRINSRQKLDPHGQLRCSPAAFRRALASTGLYPVNAFLPLPRLEFAEEFVLPASRFLELPHNWHPLLHLARRLGRYELFADGIVYLVAPGRLEAGELFDVLARQIGLFDGGEKKRLTLERFDLRQRGAMALFLTEKPGDRGFIARVVSDIRSREIVRGNQEFISYLHSCPELTEWIRMLLPRPFGEFNHGGCSVFLETLVRGIPAWKVNRESLRERIFNGSRDFIFRMQCALKRNVRLNEEVIGRMFEKDCRLLRNCPGAVSSIYEETMRSIGGIRGILRGREGFLSVSHGDYGYGNILVDPNSGELTGVIDWDTGRGEDLPGIDFLNLLVQKLRAEKGYGFYRAFVEACSDVLSRGCLDEQGLYAKEFGISGNLLNVVLHAALLRYISRAAQYPEVFCVEQNDFILSFKHLKKEVPL